MKNPILFSCSFILSLLILSCQSQEKPLNKNAVDLGNLSKLSQAVYQKVKPFDVIMVGEMHGTQEPAKLVYSMAKLIADNEGQVYVGLEIPEQQINLKREELNEENLLKTGFFSGENGDGRNGQSGFELILNCSADKRIEIFYFDNFITDDRDSSMYLEIKKIKALYPERKILTLSGNVHNKLIPFRGQKTMGLFITKDSLAFDPSKIMSINHLYKEGTMMNNIGNGLELREVKGIDMSKTSKYKNFLSEMPPESQKEYNYYFYTEKVNHSEKMVLFE